MIKKSSHFWKNIKTQLDIWFFFEFLLTFILNIRKVLFYFPIEDVFNEYSGIYIYLSDIFLILAIISWLILILYNNAVSLSRIKLWISSVIHKLYISLPLFLVFLSFVSILWSQNLSIAVYKSIKLLEFYLLYVYIIFRFVPQMFHVEHFNFSQLQKDSQSKTNNVPRGTLLEKTENQIKIVPRGTIWLFFNIIIFLGLIQGLIGIIQFFLQKSIGLFWLKESLISPIILGVAKIILSGETYIRAYGLMPHPNILGGFLLFSILIALLYQKLFHVEQSAITKSTTSIVPRGTILENSVNTEQLKILKKDTDPNTLLHNNKKCSTWNIISNILIFRLILVIQILALILTFSKSAIIGFIIALIYINVPRGTLLDKKQNSKSNCSTWNNWIDSFRINCKKLFHVEQFRLITLSTLVVLLFTFIIAKPNLNSLLFKSLEERIFYLNVPRGTIASDPILGIGAGQSVLSMQKFYSQTLDFWQYQPIHNVFLLMLSELGLVGISLFIWWLWKLFHVEQFNVLQEGIGKNNKHILHNNSDELSRIIAFRYFSAIFLGLIFIMLFDHYLWDIQQGSILLWLNAGFIVGISKK